MKVLGLLALFFIACTTTTLGQTLNFDVMLKYSKSNTDTNFDRSVYGISGNENYVMQIANTPNSQQVASVYDLKKVLIHQFSINESMSAGGEIEYKFKFEKTYPYKSNHLSNPYFDFKSIATDGDIETVTLTFYKNKAKTRVRSSIEFKNRKVEHNFFHLFRFATIHPLESNMNLNYENGGLVLSSTSDGNAITTSLKSFEKIHLQITIPN